MSETFQEAIRAAGLEPPKHIAPGELYRFPGRGKSKTNRAGWCKLFEDLQGGVFGDFSTGLQGQWQAKRHYTAQEKAEWQRQIKEVQSEQRKADEQEKIRQKEKSLKDWQSASPVEDHPYLSAKGIKSYGLRTDGRNLLIPLFDIYGALQGYQWIGEGGAKGFSKGCQKKGCYFFIGEPVDGEPFYIAEGYATAATTYEGKGQAVAVAFDAGNLKEVALALHKKYPNSPKIIAADNDQWTKGNPGLRYAREAAEAVGGAVIYPIFTEEAIARFKAQHGKGPTDFNGLHQLGGIAEVEKQLNNNLIPYEIIYNKSITSRTSSNTKASRGNNPSLNPSLKRAILLLAIWLRTAIKACAW
jgi:putative DNA primase/helicase